MQNIGKEFKSFLGEPEKSENVEIEKENYNFQVENSTLKIDNDAELKNKMY